tara:strand:+ start:1978 stop:2217 length:240 start_codon:yes stop_codon:yes gene_type:complete
MKTIAELTALQRELEQRLKMLSQDVVFNRNEVVASQKIFLLQQRLNTIELFLENFELIDWIVNPKSDLTRDDLINQDRV